MKNNTRKPHQRATDYDDYELNARDCEEAHCAHLKEVGRLMKSIEQAGMEAPILWALRDKEKESVLLSIRLAVLEKEILEALQPAVTAAR